jgi:hypothetical protein
MKIVRSRKSEVNAFLKQLPRGGVDPVAATVAVFNILGGCYKARNFRLDPSHEEFKAVRQAVLYLLNRARALSRLGFWEHLRTPETLPLDLVPEVDMRAMEKRIVGVRTLLREAPTTARDLVEAMDTVDDAFRSMHLLFAFGLMMPGHEPAEIKRYICAAFLTPVVDQLNRVWIPLQATLKKSEVFHAPTLHNPRRT